MERSTKYSTKENEGKQPAGAESLPSKSLLETPSRSRFHSSESATPPSRLFSDVAIAAVRKTPMGASKLLRDRLERVALDATTPRHRRRRLIESGAMRMEKQQTQQQKSLNTPKRFTPARRRIGYDGTPNTPSCELLSDTACSRSRQVRRPRTPTTSPIQSTLIHDDEHDNYDKGALVARANLDAAVATSSFPSSPSSSSHTRPSPPEKSSSHQQQVGIRKGCMDPVALTLWNDGLEDVDYLVEHDKASREDGVDVGKSPDRCSKEVTEVFQYSSPFPSSRAMKRTSPTEPTNVLVFHTNVTRPVPKRPFH